MKFGIGEFVDMVMIGFERVEVFQKVIGVPSFRPIQEALDMIDSLVSLVVMSD
jgi:hypothetical protein